MFNFWQEIPRPIIGLSPMDGVTDASFRYITARHGAPDVMLTEFVNIQSALFAPEILLKDFTYSEIERPIAAQIYGKSPDLFYKVAHIVGELGFDGLDVNMGCPAKKVAAAGCGAALIRTPELAREIIRATRQGLNDWANGQTLEQIGIRPSAVAAFKNANRLRTGVDQPVERRHLPLSVKTRIGYEREAIGEWIPRLLEEQPAAVTLHGRTLAQGYKGDADWDAIARTVELAKGSETLILGNGDIQDLPDAHRRIRDTHVDGVLIGRAAQGNPWLFARKNEVKQALRGNSDVTPQPPVTLQERFAVIREHSRHYETIVQIRCFVGMRKHLIWYCRDFRGAAEMRSQMVRLSSSAEVERCLENFCAAGATATTDFLAQSPLAYRAEREASPLAFAIE